MNLHELEQFADEMDIINDELTELTNDLYSDVNETIARIRKADEILKRHGMNLDGADLEQVEADLETPEEGEAVNFNIPVYKAVDQTEYNLIVTYFMDDGSYEIDLELQYEWETDDEDFYLDDEDEEF